MKDRNNLRILIPVFGLMIVLFASCREQPAPLDEVRQFRPDDKYFRAGLISLHFITEVSPIPKVDSAYREMISAYDLPLDAAGAKDGTWTGSSPYDAFDYRHQATIEIENGQIVSVDYNEIHRNGTGKQEDESYCEEMSITGTTPAIAYPAMEAQLPEVQNLELVDGVSGATYSLYRFRYAVMIALMKAGI